MTSIDKSDLHDCNIGQQFVLIFKLENLKKWTLVIFIRFKL